MRFRAFLASALLAVGCLGQAHASTMTQIASPDFSLAVHDATGQPLPIRSRSGWAKIEPHADQPHTVVLTNTTNERIAIIASIDGVDPFSGKKAYLGQKVRVLDPGKTLVIGHMHHRKMGKQALRFDRTRKVGTIDVIAYREDMTYPHLFAWSDDLQKQVGGEVRPGAGRGELLWLPPSGAPFRKRSVEPSSALHLEYGHSEMIREQLRLDR